ncbi:MAG TPA: VTT domain-containing protein [Chitinophagaceae bacterium]|nr:VTT domain-containing protein [Chitinophagaceae bacterium]
MFELLDAGFHWSELLQPQWYIENGGLWLLLFVVFAETGLFVGFFLPGDSLLFVSGIFAHEITTSDNFQKPGLGNQVLHWFGLEYPNYSYWLDLIVLVGLISVCGILGNAVGYWTGRKVGPAMYHWKDRLLFKKRYLHQAHDFYEKHGALAIVGARFLPFIRTFAPIVAGIVQMDRKKFHFFNVVGCIAWVTTMILGGFFLQKWILAEFGFDLKEHLELIVLGIVLVTTAPVIYKIIVEGKKHKKQKTGGQSGI